MLHCFALRIETCSLVAAEVSDQTAASLLDKGEPILLGTFADLGRLAHRLQLPLVTISCGSKPASRAARSKTAHAVAVA